LKCFYHKVDFDGECSGAIVKRSYPQCEMIGINYGDEFPWDSIELDETIFMVDFGMQPFDDMVKLKEKCGKLIWIDHHSTALNDLKESGVEFDGIQKEDKAGCELTWEYLNPDTPLPDSVYYLGRYDVWDLNANPNILSFQYGMKQYEDTTPESNIWNEILPSKSFKEYLNGKVNPNHLAKIIVDGNLILKYQKAENKKRCEAMSFETEFEGLKAIAMNMGMTSSQIFDSVYDENKYDIMLPFSRKLGQWTVSIYTTKDNIHVGKIAKKYGGGGHKGAAGFQCSKLPFKA